MGQAQSLGKDFDNEFASNRDGINGISVAAISQMRMMVLLGILFSGIYPATARTDDATFDDVVADLIPMVAPVGRPIYVYHYADLRQMGVSNPNNTNDPKIKAHFREWANYYWNRSQDGHGGQNGQEKGFYAASDPLISDTYTSSGNGYLLNRIELGNDLKVLNLEDSMREPKEKAARYLVRMGCTNDYLSLFQLHQEGKCRNLQLKLLTTLNIDVIRFPFLAARIPDCSSEIHDAGFIILRPDRIPPPSVRTFLYAKDDSQDPDGGRERRILRSIEKHAGLISDRGENVRLPKSIPGSTEIATDEDTRAYEAQHLLNCTNLEQTQSRKKIADHTAAICTNDHTLFLLDFLKSENASMLGQRLK